ncbi:MAG: calcium/sodium antiporter [Candidatus Nanopelagicales bacterium]
MSILDIARVALGLIVLVGGGELLVRGASAVAARWGLSRLVIGLTVVAVGTSAPEFAVTVGAVARGETDLAVGNVVGSNIANILLILGIAALVLPLAVKAQLVRFDVPVMIALSAALLVCSLDGYISRLDAGLLLAVTVAHTITTVLLGRRQEPPSAVPEAARAQRPAAVEPAAAEPGPPSGSPTATTGGPSTAISVVSMVTGIALLVAGANLLVAGAVNIATSLGVSGLIIGLTVVAIGTSLPELATSLIAAIRGERDIAIGNVVGSCIANIGLVLALPALFTSRGIPVAAPAIALDIPLMLAAAVALAPVIFTGFTVQRWEGALFLTLYLSYVTYLVLDATGHQSLTGFTWALVLFVLPLTVITLIATLAYDLGRRSSSTPGERRRARSPGQ